MKILVFSDLHGNLDCLKKVIKTKDFKTADKKIFLGDVAFGCSRPNKCINLLRKHNVINIAGNNDLYISSHIPIADASSFDSSKFAQMQYMEKNISQKNKNFINTWPKQLNITLANKNLYFCHYAWETIDEEESVVDTPQTPNPNFCINSFKNINADYIFFGHEHKEYSFSINEKHYFCLDTIGLKNPGSYFVLYDNNGKININRKSLEHNLIKEKKLMYKAKYPFDKNKIQ